MNNNIQSLGQVAGVDTDQKTNKALQIRAVQFLSLFGIDAQPQGNQVSKLMQFVTNMPQFKGEYHADEYENQWQQSPGIVQNQNSSAISKQGYQYTW